MRFRIEDGLDIISIRLSEIGSYFRCSKPLSTVWYDCAGSVGKYLCLLPYEPGHRDEIRRRLVDHLNEDYKGREPELKELLNPLLKLFPSGEYNLAYFNGVAGFSAYPASTDNYEDEYHLNWNLEFAPIGNVREKEQKIKTHATYLAEYEIEKVYSADLWSYTTSGFYDAFEKAFIATQPEHEIDPERVKYFENEIRNGARPFAILFSSYLEEIVGDSDRSLDSACYVIDGHHKLLAYRNLKVRPSIVEITHYPAQRADAEFNVEELIGALYPWHMEHLLKHWRSKDVHILKYLQDPDSKVHRFVRNGHVKMFHENGQLKHEAFYINDKMDGEGKWWYDNGQLHRVEYAKRGARYGVWKSWYKSGNILFVQPFDEKGNYDGHMISYYESGKVRWEQFMKKGVNLDGYSYFAWFDDGSKEAELEYLNGRMIKRKNYNRTGVMVNFEELDTETNRLVKKI